MLSSAANYISSIVIEGSMIGIVQFEETSTILSQLITVHSDDDRNELLEALPKAADGATCIGCGLLDAIKVMCTAKCGQKTRICIFILRSGCYCKLSKVWDCCSIYDNKTNSSVS